MARAVWLREGDSPPGDENWVSVTYLPSGKYEIASAIQRSSDSVGFRHMTPQAQSVDEVVEMACQMADEAGVPIVYVKADMRVHRS